MREAGRSQRRTVPLDRQRPQHSQSDWRARAATRGSDSTAISTAAPTQAVPPRLLASNAAARIRGRGGVHAYEEAQQCWRHCRRGPRAAAGAFSTASSIPLATRRRFRINNLGVAGRTIYVKAEFFNPAASVKDRLALNIVEAAERAGALKPGQTIVEATSGNTGIGLAMVCAQKGYPLVVTMADSFSIERRKLMRMLGAKVVLTPRAQKGFGMYQKAVELAKAHGWFLARQFETAGQRRHPRAHHGARDRRRFRRRASRRLRHRLRHGRHADRRRARAAARAARDPHRAVRTRERGAGGERRSAGKSRRRRARRQPPGLAIPPDPGLDAGLHSGRAARGDRPPRYYDELAAGRRRRRNRMGAGNSRKRKAYSPASPAARRSRSRAGSRSASRPAR